ncbi:uncharacterized protein CC84DRAFT_1247466 [Paraphaeosphaeria sporulosa]|uniref:Uncharacterized protein n=1 Tax=Paraphaeosphaeria sporulosa TaxID=1460663 RepID=A0A177CCQ7_9PLEO|nr:uncharacterized protein CC84DRAFT_1247466 [Paraphaeosphaeria sporulosa]OAG04961.1 hypothetical protein CC84DRAFT_1247466 [Paraphaeosphaeria sporulosa]
MATSEALRAPHDKANPDAAFSISLVIRFPHSRSQKCSHAAQDSDVRLRLGDYAASMVKRAARPKPGNGTSHTRSRSRPRNHERVPGPSAATQSVSRAKSIAQWSGTWSAAEADRRHLSRPGQSTACPTAHEPGNHLPIACLRVYCRVVNR